jgi:hypothetical protein
MSFHKVVVPLYALCGPCSSRCPSHRLYKLNNCMDNGHGNASLSLDVANCSSLLVAHQAPHDIVNNRHFGPSKLLHNKASNL